MEFFPLGNAELGIRTFLTSVHANDQCGSDGLPLTPNSIKVFGRFQQLKDITHPNLCRYVDIARGKHERLIVVQEHYKTSLATEANSGIYSCISTVIRLAYQILQGIDHLNRQGLVHRCLSPKAILIDGVGCAKLTNFGLYTMTDYGTSVDFPIGSPSYLAPEVLASGRLPATLQLLSSPKTDVWSLGVILLELLLGIELWSKLNMASMLKQVICLLQSHEPVQDIAHSHGVLEKLKNVPSSLLDLLTKCLTVKANSRPYPSDLLQHPVFAEEQLAKVPSINGLHLFTGKLRCRKLELPPVNDLLAEGEEAEDMPTDYLAERGMDEVYYLWSLAGGDLENELSKRGMIKKKPPIFMQPNVVLQNGEPFGQEAHRSNTLDETVVCLSLDTLKDRLKEVHPSIYFPLLEELKPVLPMSPSMSDLSATATLPLIIREKDIEYQLHRVVLFKRLLEGYPYKRSQIWREARVDIPPLVRPYVWATLLDIEGDVRACYDAIDKRTATATDRQIEVDIPRCHQYNELLSSPESHGKFKRVLKAWVISHPQYVYWQGLDSLCASFIYLNFNDEALAYACMTNFINKYLHKFFMKDNAAVIQEYLAVFSHMIAFHDPDVSNHLDTIGFIPELYAIPWFLTMYAHVFPLHKIFHLWDTLLLGDSSLPLFIGVAILKQLRTNLLSFGFNECILVFSDLPEIDMEKCVQASIHFFRSTPKSATFRQHARPKTKGEKSGEGRALYTKDALPLADSEGERCAPVSARDLFEPWCGSRPPRPPPADPPPARSTIQHPARPGALPVLVIDVRLSEDYLRGTVPGAVNIPFASAFSPDGGLVSSSAVSQLYAHRGRLVVVVGNRGNHAAQFAGELVAIGFSKVCVLHNGLDALKSTGLMSVPRPEI
ncbi:PREDICTED: LOW QUALITY PROTEIN: TBC domain-containing protein kinase-like protein [Priapulus caudatus]|uniref:LOW QUALITY PROTEIN: TBC domain-containing protein kinase-like protein n=1 Tax=Priapulus caudatus TaxID=37621 RepID=A0ABM1EEU5_PRICU|nr:PREDICTED: LOW QUALITY PROTEIN: TBC domain-containing protein kinase-like protein [Priapulus caudatus]